MGLAEFMRVLMRRWVLIVLAGLIAAGTAAVVGDRQPPVYSATAQVLVREGLSDGVARLLPVYMRNIDRDWNTRVAGLQSQELAQAVVDSKGFEIDPAVLAARVTVAPDSTTGLVSVSVSNGDPKLAADMTNAIATQYAKDARATQEAQLNTAIAAAEERVVQARQRVTPLGPASPVGTSYLGIGSYEEAASLLDTLRMGAATQVDPVDVVREAVPPAAVAGGAATKLKTALFGLFAGLALGVVLALVLEYLARSESSAGSDGA